MKKYLTILVVLAGVIAFFVYYLLFAAPAPKVSELTDNSVPPSKTEEVKPDTPQPFAGEGTMDDLRQRGEDIECTISYIPNGSEKAVEGTYFVSQGEIRGDFLVPAPDLSGQILSSMIIDKDFLYTWTEIDGQAYGAKLAVALLASNQAGSNEPVSLQAEVKYDCKPWVNVDNSVFIPPSQVLFKDMDELQKAGMEYGTTYEELPPIQ